MFIFLSKFKVMHNSKKVIFLRSIQTIGYLHKTFDFDQKEIAEAKQVNFNIKEETYEKLLSLVPIEMLGTVPNNIFDQQWKFFCQKIDKESIFWLKNFCQKNKYSSKMIVVQIETSFSRKKYFLYKNRVSEEN